MHIRNLISEMLVLGIAMFGFTACDDSGGGTPSDAESDSDVTLSDVIPADEFRDRAILILDNPDTDVTLIEASEDQSVGFGAFGENLILQGSEQSRPTFWHFVGANDGADLLMGTEAFTVRFDDADRDGTGSIQLLDATEATFATRDDVVLEADEVQAKPGRDIETVIDALEATESDLRGGRWRALANEAESLLNATEAAPAGISDAIEPLLLAGIESVQVIREGLLLAEEDLTSGGSVNGPNVFRVPEENDEFLAGVEVANLLDSEAREAFRDIVSGIAQELLLLAANEAVPGNFLPTTLLTLAGTEVSVGTTPDIPFTGAKKVAIGTDHSCAVDLNDQLFCWGNNDNGQLGTGSRLPEVRPRLVGTATYSDVTARNDTSCAIELGEPRRGFCWGSNEKGQLAVDTSVASSTAPTTIGLTDLRSIATGNGHSCSVNAMGALSCWGDNSDGQLGVPAIADSTFTPTQIGTSTDWNMVSSGAIHTCAINDTLDLFCWGFNTDGRAGLGDTPQADVPTQVGTDTWKQVSAGGAFSCGINTADELYCWGANGFGQLGIGSELPSTTPIQVGTETWNSVSTGFLHGCAIRNDGALFCWGSNFGGRLGLGDTTQRNDPTRVGTELWSAVSVGTDHGCAIRADDSSLWCWGANDIGQLGDGTTDSSLEPVQVVE